MRPRWALPVYAAPPAELPVLMKEVLRRLDEEEDPAAVKAAVLADEGKTEWLADAMKILDVEFVPILSKRGALHGHAY